MQPFTVNINNPIEVDVLVDFMDTILLYPDTDGGIRDALNGDITVNDERGSVGHFWITMRYQGLDMIECTGIIIDEWFDDYVHSDGLANMADALDETATQTFHALEEWDDYISEEEDVMIDSPCALYLDRLFVHQSYRGNGIASFVLKNLPKLIRAKYGYNVRYTCLLLKPDEQNLMSEEKMEGIMKKTVENVGFVRISMNDNYIIYAKRC